jgi:hypothetical protein
MQIKKRVESKRLPATAGRAYSSTFRMEHHSCSSIQSFPKIPTKMSFKVDVTVTIDEQTFTVTNVTDEEMRLLREAKRGPSDISRAIRTAIAYVRRDNSARTQIRAALAAIIFRGMADHDEDRCRQWGTADEHVEHYLTYQKALVDPKNGFLDDLARADLRVSTPRILGPGGVHQRLTHSANSGGDPLSRACGCLLPSGWYEVSEVSSHGWDRDIESAPGTYS